MIVKSTYEFDAYEALQLQVRQVTKYDLMRSIGVYLT